MIKRKRKLNKQKLVKFRRYTVVNNNAVVKHFFENGEVVERLPMKFHRSLTTGLLQVVYPECLI